MRGDDSVLLEEDRGIGSEEIDRRFDLVFSSDIPERIIRKVLDLPFNESTERFKKYLPKEIPDYSC